MSEADNPMHAIITKCWEDEAFKERLLADPAATLAAEGVQIPEGITVNVVVDTDDVRTLVIPLRPETARMVDEDLTDIAIGSSEDETEGLVLQQGFIHLNQTMELSLKLESLGSEIASSVLRIIH